MYITSDKFKEHGVSRAALRAAMSSSGVKVKTIGRVRMYCLEDIAAFHSSRVMDAAAMRELMRDFRVSQTSIAKDLGYTKQMVSLVFRGETAVSLKFEAMLNQWLRSNKALTNASKWANTKTSDLFRREEAP